MFSNSRLRKHAGRLLLLGLAISSLAAEAAPGETLAVSVGLPGYGPVNWSEYPSISADGRFLAFTSLAPDIVVGDTNPLEDIFVLDRQTGTATIASVNNSGLQRNLSSYLPFISHSGRFVSFSANAALLPGQGGAGFRQIFVRDRLLGTTTIASVAPGGQYGNGDSDISAISSDGRYVAFESRANNLGPSDTNGWPDIYVRDMVTGSISLANIDSNGQQGPGAVYFPTISGDGRTVAFVAVSNLSPADTNNAYDVYVYDRQTASTSLVSLDQAGLQAIGGDRPSLSFDGRIVAFSSGSANVVPGDTNGVNDVFVRDRQTGTSTRISVTSSGGQSNNGCGFVSLSADGRHASFYGLASNLVPGDVNNREDVFVHNMNTGVTELVSVASDGTQGTRESILSSISGEGSVVAFDSQAPNLVPNDYNIEEDVFIRVLASNTTSKVSVGTAPVLGNKASEYFDVSPDGRYVAFDSSATNLVNPQVSGRHVFLRDMNTGEVSVVTANANGTIGNIGGVQPRFSANGRHIVFISNSGALVPGDTNGKYDIFVRNLDTNTTTLVSLSSDEVQGNSDCLLASISADGRFVAFDSRSTNVVPGDTNGTEDIFVRDTVSGTTTRVSVTSAGAQLVGTSITPFISSDGRYVAFSSTSADILAGDTNNWFNVFIHDRVLGTTQMVDVQLNGMPGSLPGFATGISADGKMVAFTSRSPNIVPGDSETVEDVFVRDMTTGVTSRVNLSESGAEASWGTGGSLSADGRYCTFEAQDSVVTGDTNLRGDVFVRDLKLGYTIRASISSTGGQGNENCSTAVISEDGRFVTFRSQATNLVAQAKKRNTIDVYRHEIPQPLTLTLSYSNWLGTSKPSPVQYIIRTTGGVVKFSGPTTVDSNGHIEIPRPANGNYELLVKATTFLQKKLSFEVQSSTSDLGIVTLTNGDIVGDNIVDVADYGALASSFDATPSSNNWNPRADLNGDLIVDIADYTVLAQNFDQAGDE